MLKWVFGADTGPFRSGLKQMRSEVQGFSGSVKGQIAGALGLGVIAAGFRELMDSMGRLDDLSQRLGMSAESLQRIGQVATLSGADIETLAKGLTTLTRNLSEAEDGSQGLADAAAVLGINIAVFKKLTPESQMILLSRGLTEAKDSGQGLAAVMTLLGKSGAELVPMLKMGPEALAEALKAVTVTSGTTVRSIAALGDGIDALKHNGQVLGGYFFQIFSSIGSIAGGVIGTIVSQYLAGFKAIIGGAKDLGTVVKSALSGDMSGVEKGMDSFQKRFSTLGESLKNNLKNGAKTAFDEVSDIWNRDEITPERKTADSDVESAAAAAKALEDSQEKQKRLAEDIAKLEEDARMRQLSLDEKILDLKKQQAEAAADHAFGGGNDALEARKRELEIGQQIEQLQKQSSDDQARINQETEASLQRIAQLKAEGAKIDQQNRMVNMTTEEKIAELGKNKAMATIESFEAAAAGDVTKSIEKDNEVKSIDGDIQNLKNEDKPKDKAPSILVEDLRKIGGGGAGVLTSNPQQGVETRLDRLIKAVEANKPGSPQVERAKIF